AELLPPGGWVVLSQAARTIDRANRTYSDAEALAQAVGWPGPPAVFTFDEALGDRVQLHLSEFTEGLDLGLEHWGTAAGNAAELGLGRAGARPGRLCGSSRPRGGTVRGHHAPRARGRRARLPRARVRRSGQALRSVRPGGDGREVPGWRRAAASSPRWLRLGARHGKSTAGGARHGRRARQALLRADGDLRPRVRYRRPMAA